MKKNLLTAFRRTFSTALYKWLMGGFGTLSAVLLAGKNYLNYPVKISISIGIGLLLILYFFRFLGFFAIATYASYKEKTRVEVYGDAIIILNDAFAKLHLLRKHETITEKQLVDTMRHLCQQLKVIFDKITGEAFSAVSITVPVEKSQEIADGTLVRHLAWDRKAFQQRETTACNEIDHKIIENTRYIELLNKLTRNEKDNLFYLNNNIAGSTNYYCSRKNCYVDNKLPYNAELVVPIIPLAQEHANNYTVAGFLSVDCAIGFQGIYDVAILQGVADGIYDLIKPNMTKIQAEINK